MPSPQSLNDIGPGIMIESRSGSWSVRFRLTLLSFDLVVHDRKQPVAETTLRGIVNEGLEPVDENLEDILSYVVGVCRPEITGSRVTQNDWAIQRRKLTPSH